MLSSLSADNVDNLLSLCSCPIVLLRPSIPAFLPSPLGLLLTFCPSKKLYVYMQSNSRLGSLQSQLRWSESPRVFLKAPYLIHQFSHSVVSDSLRPHGLQHTRPPCPSPTLGVYSNLCPLSQWCHPTISSSVVPFSSRLQSFPPSGSFQMSQLFASGGQSIHIPTQLNYIFSGQKLGVNSLLMFYKWFQSNESQYPRWLVLKHGQSSKGLLQKQILMRI